MSVACTLREVLAAFGHTAFRTCDAESKGITGDRLERAAASGDLRRLTRGTYLVADGHQLDAWRLAHSRARVWPGGEAVVGGDGAAQRWAIPLLAQAGPVPTLLLPTASRVRTGTKGGVRIVREDLSPEDVDEDDSGPGVTLPLRTAIDVIRHRRLDVRMAAATLSIAQRRHIERCTPLDPFQLSKWMTQEEVRDGVARSTIACLARAPRRGATHVRAALEFCDPRVESVLEALSWHDFLEAELPAPIPQAWVQGASGRWYCVDFLWRGARVIGEADGAVKYTAAQDVMAEKARQADLEAAGYRFVRWTWADAMGKRTFLRRVALAVVPRAVSQRDESTTSTGFPSPQDVRSPRFSA